MRIFAPICAAVVRRPDGESESLGYLERIPAVLCIIDGALPKQCGRVAELLEAAKYMLALAKALPSNVPAESVA